MFCQGQVRLTIELLIVSAFSTSLSEGHEFRTECREQGSYVCQSKIQGRLMTFNATNIVFKALKVLNPVLKTPDLLFSAP